MTQLLPETIWKMKEKEFRKLLNKNLLVPKRKTVRFYAPSFMYYKTNYYCSSSNVFPTISLTGKNCSLRCKHCDGKILETMYSATTPEKLFKLCVMLKKDGALGCLISGGCLQNGSVPLEKFIDVIRKVKNELGIKVFVHTGIIDFDTAKKIRSINVDAALIDIIGSNEIIKEIFNLNVTVEDYKNSLKALQDVHIAFVPHVIVGLYYGKLKSEFHSLKVISNYKPSALVIIAFMPIRGTEMAAVEPPKPIEIAKVIAVARIMFPYTPLVLGCMRPRGKHRIKTDVLALKAGVNAIAFPNEKAIKFAESQGYTLHFSSSCCAQIYSDFKSMQNNRDYKFS